MSDLLDRATGLLDVLAAARGAPMALRTVAARSGVPAATCSRVLKRLAASGWVDQDGNRGGYRLGPHAYALADGHPYAAGLVELAAPTMRALADATGGTCILSILRPWRRQLVWACTSGGEAGHADLRAEEDVWARASGRMLVAALTPAERRRWIRRLGPPDLRRWPGVATRSELLGELAVLRRQGWAASRDDRAGTRGAAVLIGDGAGGHAAIGVYLPADRWEASVLATLRAIVADGVGAAPSEAVPGGRPG